MKQVLILVPLKRSFFKNYFDCHESQSRKVRTKTSIKLKTVNNWDIMEIQIRPWTFKICQESKKLNDWDMLCREPKSKLNKPSREINSKSELWINKRKKLPKNFLYAKSGGPPLKEYKQSQAEHEASPHPDPIKRIIFQNILLLNHRNPKIQQGTNFIV